MKTNPQVQYYLVKDFNLINLFVRLVEMREEAYEDIICFIETYAPKAELYSIKTAGNLQIEYKDFRWIFPTIDDIPKKSYKNLTFTDKGILAELDISTEEGRKLKKEQLDLMALATVDMFELWDGEIAPLLGWNFKEEPTLVYNKSQRLFILVSDHIPKIAKFGTGYSKPAGVRSIPQEQVIEMMKPH